MSRRGFLKVATAVAGGSLGMSGPTGGHDASLRVPPGKPPSRVVEIRAQRVVDGPNVQRAPLREMLDGILASLTNKRTPTEAWRSILRPDDVIALKFNQSGQAKLGTTSALAGLLIESLTGAGWRSDQIVCIEAPAGVEAARGTTPAMPGYASTETDFGSGTDQLATVLGQVTAIVNVPFLKTHNIAGLTCGLKNLSHAMVKHPARYHRNGCSPYIADIFASPAIRSKVRLTLVDALRVVFDRGPEVDATNTRDEGLLVASFDTVAADARGLMILNRVRRSAGLEPVAQTVGDIRYLRAAHESGLGIASPTGIELLTSTL